MGRLFPPAVAAVCTLLSITACGWSGLKKQAAKEDVTEIHAIKHPAERTAKYAKYTVEDTVRHQIGGELYYLDIAPSDSITVIEARHIREHWGLFRYYRFIVHNRHSRMHHVFEPSSIEENYNSYLTNSYYIRIHEEVFQPELDASRTEYIDPAIEKFNGYWLSLAEYDGNYYLDDSRSSSCSKSFHINDSIVTSLSPGGPYPRKMRKAIVSKGTLILYDQENNEIRIEPVDIKREIYKQKDIFIIPARAIHNFEIIGYTNNFGHELI